MEYVYEVCDGHLTTECHMLMPYECPFRGLVRSPCERINVMMTSGGGVLVHDVLELHCQQTLD